MQNDNYLLIEENSIEELFNKLGQKEVFFTGFIYVKADKNMIFLSPYPELKSCCQGSVPQRALFLDENIENIKFYHQKIVTIKGSLDRSSDGSIALKPIQYIFKKKEEIFIVENFIAIIVFLIIVLFFYKNFIHKKFF